MKILSNNIRGGNQHDESICSHARSKGQPIRHAQQAIPSDSYQYAGRCYGVSCSLGRVFTDECRLKPTRSRWALYRPHLRAIKKAHCRNNAPFCQARGIKAYLRFCSDIQQHLQGWHSCLNRLCSNRLGKLRRALRGIVEHRSCATFRRCYDPMAGR